MGDCSPTSTSVKRFTASAYSAGYTLPWAQCGEAASGAEHVHWVAAVASAQTDEAFNMMRRNEGVLRGVYEKLRTRWVTVWREEPFEETK
eukprot:CAMPEP_0181180984 /NCGR_PEP_ID=MMETSP1096-20121128/7098_1 /TAXON_ID=156174 ORGANISM="Chrysochromulina ericina, Strain CCMP281" /NCGR_SAMPLE_ID=MMETSP1096 /ASSEMBLY_ACC=CAM_ASM_000453 /LENGTH=89 /DNA_ID=CAMNT_0023269463 /DNA_START=355 /DNA_END=620 /DNA_ORIENTATION=-